jgi:hypothetical protein
MKKLTTLALILSTLVAAPEALAGKYAGEFLTLGSGARGLALGQAMTAISNDPFSWHWNPAGLARVNQRSLSGMAATDFGSISDPLGSHVHFGFTLPIGQANLALNYVRYQVSDIPIFPDLGDGTYSFEDRWKLVQERGGSPDGYFRSIEQALIVSVAKMTDFTIQFGWLYRDIPVEMPAGFSFKLLHQDLWSDEGVGLSLDGGVQFRAKLEDLISIRRLGWISFGTRLSNFANSGMRWDGGRDALNFNYALGFAWENSIGDFSWTLARDIDHHYSTSHHSGLEIGYRNIVFLRTGVQGRDGEWTYGAGFRFQRIDLDYAGLSHDLGRVHRMSFSLSF